MLKSLIKYICISISWEVKNMTRPKINNVCDFCSQEIATGNEYSELVAKVQLAISVSASLAARNQES